MLILFSEYLITSQLILIIQHVFLSDENGAEAPATDGTTEEANISNGSNSELPSDENKDMNTDTDINLTKQLSEEETVINTAVED